MVTNTQEKVIFHAQVATDIRDELVRRAVAADRSLSAQIRRALVEHIKREEEQ